MLPDGCRPQESLMEVITPMWKDRSPLSIGSVAVAFEAVCPTRLDLLHKHYRRLCKTLVDVDEWGQGDLLNLLLRYARTMLPRPKEDEEIDKDVHLLLTSTEPLFYSRNPAVVIAAVRVVYYVGPPSFHPKIVDPLLRILHMSPELERIVLSYILASTPSLFSSHFTHFLISYGDIPDTKATKLRLLLAILNFDNHAGILRELVEQEAVHEIGRCAVRVPECAEQCVNALLGMVDHGNDQAVVVLKNLVPAATVERLAGRLDTIHDPSARATVVWLTGQYAEGSSAVDGLASYVPDVLRRMAKSFKEEKGVVKLQVLTMAAKLTVLSTDQRIGQLTKYVLQMARYDVDWDVRDRARMLVGLLAGLDPTPDSDEREGVVLRREQVKMVLFQGKKNVVEPDEPVNATIGTWSAITGKRSIDEPILPDWLENGVESVLRDSEDDVARVVPPPVTAISSSSASQQRVVASVPQKVEQAAPWKKNLDQFYQEEEEDSGEDEDSGASQSESDGEPQDGSEESSDEEDVDDSEEDETESNSGREDIAHQPS
ncbi:ARM repeat-containing protein [Hymenopellis radicata]|nr:ARM repeat-containing protein [Hymenopellis radicata]